MKFSIVFLTCALFACGNLKPEKISISTYPELETSFNGQHIRLSGQLEKTVSLDGKTETKVLDMDSISWNEELTFLVEINPNQPEYVGAFTKSTAGLKTTLILNPDEKGALKKFVFEEVASDVMNIQATVHEDKDVYVHHRDVSVEYEDGVVSKYLIEGYQKILLKDTIFFSIEGKVK